MTAIKDSLAWHQGQNAIVVIWDEDDYSISPTVNKVLLIVDTNYGSHGVSSNTFYTHFSLLRSIEGGLGLPCLNHACDATTAVMSDLFGTPNCLHCNCGRAAQKRSTFEQSDKSIEAERGLGRG